ncbi:[LysW]-aminoadipate kinase [uncultured Thermanaerothrix sp.]|uniref:[LysW]-aminoadipate kinase n=1 Tax=uncultured Thermanaerothrix sp. TaxID=1195149 RepID=UPI00263649A1|nr:[LysW]-aminoadipate kinase [uncultured Thermanaerothrix sp.]
MNGNGHSQTLVVKLGGTEGVDFAAICQDVVALQREGWQMVLVHGGSAEANALGEALGYPPRFVTSPSGFTSRYTDRKTLEIFAAAVNGRVNTLLVEQLQALGINALGLSGLDGRLMVARRKDAIRIIENGRQKILRDDYTGTIESVNVGLLRLLLKEGYVPVVAPLALSPQGEALNVDADRAAAMIAVALQAATLVLLTGVPGLLRTFPDESTLIPRLSLAEMDRALGYAEGRMKKKILGAQEALRGGVGRVIIADGRVGQPLVKALQGAGTWITS